MTSEIIIALITSGALVGIIEIIRGWNSKRRTDSAQADKAEIDLADDYKKKTFDLVNEVFELSKKGLTMSEDHTSSLGELKTKMTSIESEVTCMAAYLNGDYKKYKEDHPVVQK